MSKRLMRFIYGIISIFFAAATGYAIYMLAAAGEKPLVTAVVEPASVDDGLVLSGVLIRDEEIIPKTPGQHYVLLVSDGERVSAGASLCAYFSDEEDARLYRRMRDIEGQIALLNSVFSEDRDAPEIAEANSSVYEALRGIVSGASSGVFAAGPAGLETALLRALLLRERTLGAEEEGRAAVAALTDEKNALSAELTRKAKYIKAARAGYFSTLPDGREGHISAEDPSELTPEEVEAAAARQAAEIDAENILGKMIYGYSWHIAVPVKAEAAALLSSGKTYTLLISGDKHSARAEGLNYSREKDRAVAVFRIDTSMPDMSVARTMNCTVVLNTYEGFKIPTEAMRARDGQQGVYVLEGATAVYKPVEILYTAPDFYVVKASTADRSELFIYDEVILGRKDLYDGKVMR